MAWFISLTVRRSRYQDNRSRSLRVQETSLRDYAISHLAASSSTSAWLRAP